MFEGISECGITLKVWLSSLNIEWYNNSMK